MISKYTTTWHFRYLTESNKFSHFGLYGLTLQRIVNPIWFYIPKDYYCPIWAYYVCRKYVKLILLWMRILSTHYSFISFVLFYVELVCKENSLPNISRTSLKTSLELTRDILLAKFDFWHICLLASFEFWHKHRQNTNIVN